MSSYDEMVRVPGCLCESCEFIARLREFTRSPESEFAPLRDFNPEKFRSIQLRCPQCGSTEITVGEVEAKPWEELG